MPATSEVLAKLGIDTRDIPSDLRDAEKFFQKFSKDIEASTAKAGSAGGKKFVDAFGGQLASSARGAIFAALGLNAQEAAKQIAGYFVKGTDEQWAAVGKISDDNSKAIGERIALNLTPKKVFDSLKAEFDAAKAEFEALNSALGGDATADERKAVLEAQGRMEKAALEIARIHKQDRDAEAAFQSEMQKAGYETLTNAEKKLTLEREMETLRGEILSSSLAESEIIRKKEDLLKKGVELRNVEKEILEENARTEKEAAAAKEKSLDSQLKAAKELKRLSGQASATQGKIDAAQISLADRSKLTIGELANLTNFGAGVSTDAGAAGQKARDVLNLEKEAEALRLLGDVAGASAAMSNIGQLRDQLVSGGFAKSSEMDPGRAIVEELKTLNTDLGKTLAEIKGVLDGKFINQ